MVLAVEILNTIYYTLVLAWPSLRGIQIPFNTNPNRISRFGIVNELSYITNGANVLVVLETNVLVEKMFFLVFIGNSDPLTEQVFVLICCFNCTILVFYYRLLGYLRIISLHFQNIVKI